MRRRALWVGSFILGALVLTAAGILWLSGNNLFERHQRAVINFQDGVPGLYVGAPVTFRGVPVGRVESIGLEFDVKSISARIPVNVRLSSGVVTYRGDRSSSPPTLEALVQRGLRAKLVEQSFVTGQRAIELNILPDAPPIRLAEGGLGPEIPALPNRLDALVGQIADLPISDLVSDMRTTLKTTQATLETVRVAMQSMNTTLDQTGREVTRLGADGRSTMAAARGAIVQLRASSEATLASITRLADTATRTTDEVRPELLRAIGSAREAADSANRAMSHMAEVTAPDAPLRSDLDGAVADLAQAARALREWSELVDEQPNALILGRRRP